MSHKDEYGRTWKFKPGHDTAMMLQISPELLHAAMQLRDIYSDFKYMLKDLETFDCYLIRMPFEGWCVGFRFSDEGPGYLSPHLDERLIDYLITRHRQRASMEEYLAISTIDAAYPPPEPENEVWAVIARPAYGGLPDPISSMSAPDRDWLYHTQEDAIEARDAVTRYYGKECAGVYRCLLRVVSEVKPTKE